MFQESKGDVLVHRVILGQNESHLEHVLTIESHPGGAIGLIEVAAGRKFGAAIEDSNVVQSEEAAGKQISAFRIFAIDPPVEVLHQALEGALKKAYVGPAQLLLDVVQEQCGPRVN